MMTMFKGMSIKTIRANLARMGIEMTDEVFNSLTYTELKTILRKARKAFHLYLEVDEIIYKPTLKKTEEKKV